MSGENLKEEARDERKKRNTLRSNLSENPEPMDRTRKTEGMEKGECTTAVLILWPQEGKTGKG